MGSFIINKSTIQGKIVVPSSKSQTLRALVFAMMASGKSVIHNALQSPDTDAMIETCRQYGAQCVSNDNLIEVEGTNGNFHFHDDVLDVGNSGIVLRFIAGIAGLSPQYTVLTGDESIRFNRPMHPLLDALRQLGVFAISTKQDGFAPVIIKGPMKGGRAVIYGPDSQPVSALLIASAFAKGETELVVRNPGEIPWIDVTLEWLDRLGIAYTHHDYRHYRVFGNAKISGFEYHVPGDFSTAAFPVAAALVTRSELSIENVDFTDTQGDKKVVTLLQKMGAKLTLDKNSIHVQKGSLLHGMEVDCDPIIDAVPILAVLGCFAKGKTRLYNAKGARSKECDRIHVVCNELKKMGADITEKEDEIIIGSSELRSAGLKSHNDHRMAMALSVAAMGAEGTSSIQDVECVNKTYATFDQDLASVGANIKRVP